MRRWAIETDPGARSALLLMIGEYPDEALPDTVRRQFTVQARESL